MTDNEQQEDTEGRELSGYARQRQKYKEELDAKDKVISDLRAQLVANKKQYFKDTLSNQGFKGDFDEFADRYADKLELNEMVALYVGNNGAPVQQTAVQQPEGTTEPQAPTIGPKSIIGSNPIGGDQPRDFNDLSAEEMKERGRQHPEIFNQ